MLRIHRTKAYADEYRKYRIILDNKEIGAINQQETLEVSIANGQHVLFMKVDWARSNKLNIDYHDGQIIDIEASPSLAGGKVFLALLYALILPFKYIKLRVTNIS